MSVLTTSPTTTLAVRRTLLGGVIPATDPTTALLSTLAVFAVAFFARPLGGFVWGAVGDRIGRKRTLALTVILMAVATTLMGCRRSGRARRTRCSRRSVDGGSGGCWSPRSA